MRGGEADARIIHDSAHPYIKILEVDENSQEYIFRS